MFRRAPVRRRGKASRLVQARRLRVGPAAIALEPHRDLLAKPLRSTRDSRKDRLGAAAKTPDGPAEAGPHEECQNVTKALSRRSRAFTQRSSTSSGLPVSATSNISTPS